MHAVRRVTKLLSHSEIYPRAYLVRNSLQAFDRILGRADWLIWYLKHTPNSKTEWSIKFA
jgi:hypothetical protein